MPPKKPKPPELEGFEESSSGAHVWIDGEMYALADGVEVIRAKKKLPKPRREEAPDASAPTEDTPVAPEAQVPQQLTKVLVDVLMRSKVNGGTAILVAIVLSFLTGGGTGAWSGGQAHKEEENRLKAQIETLTVALAQSNTEMNALKAEYAAHKETHDRQAFQIEQLAVQVREVIALENELHPRQR